MTMRRAGRAVREPLLLDAHGRPNVNMILGLLSLHETWQRPRFESCLLVLDMIPCSRNAAE
jgi:hypothetical protein